MACTMPENFGKLGLIDPQVAVCSSTGGTEDASNFSGQKPQ